MGSRSIYEAQNGNEVVAELTAEAVEELAVEAVEGVAVEAVERVVNKQVSRGKVPVFSGLAGGVQVNHQIDAVLVSASLELMVQVGINDGFSFFKTDEAAGHGADVCVVVSSGERGDFGSPTKSGPNAAVFVERHGDAVAAAANGNALFNFSIFNGFGKPVRIQ